MDTAPVKAIALPAVHRANLEFQSHVPFQHSRTRGRRGFCTLVHSFYMRLDLVYNLCNFITITWTHKQLYIQLKKLPKRFCCSDII